MPVTLLFTKNNVSYPFTCEAAPGSNTTREDKKVYIGCFKGSAPAGLESGRDYCLKWYSLNPYLQCGLAVPQMREFLDVYPFEGPHLRQILAYNDDAEKFIGTEKFIGLTEQFDFFTVPPGDVASFNFVLDCMIIEPVYRAIDRSKYGFSAKLRMILQIISGLKELRQTVLPSVSGLRITAHRDLKLDNLMLEELYNPYSVPTVRIIDFASIKCETEDAGGAPDQTALGMTIMSKSNTCPEFCDLSLPCIPEKADVFALGTIIAELFGLFPAIEDGKPLKYLVEKADHSPDRKLSTKGAAYLNGSIYRKAAAVPFAPDHPSWMEHQLKAYGIRCGAPKSAILPVFRACIAYHPGDRPTLEELEAVLKYLLNGSRTQRAVIETLRRYRPVHRVSLMERLRGMSSRRKAVSGDTPMPSATFLIGEDALCIDDGSGNPCYVVQVLPSK